ncbi:hypothetical protein [uncultured Jatrophihabitans sp.]|uniref:hypothetical protein n=1 Tax=uncultured Jatrophihabitans sp. TaxID=1610747 RepID=UPI0035CB9E93
MTAGAAPPGFGGVVVLPAGPDGVGGPGGSGLLDVELLSGVDGAVLDGFVECELDRCRCAELLCPLDVLDGALERDVDGVGDVDGLGVGAPPSLPFVASSTINKPISRTPTAASASHTMVGIGRRGGGGPAAPRDTGGATTGGTTGGSARVSLTGARRTGPGIGPGGIAVVAAVGAAGAGMTGGANTVVAAVVPAASP